MIRWPERGRRKPGPTPAKTVVTTAVAGEMQVGDRVLPLEIRRLAQARRLTLRLAPDGRAVRVSMPPWVSAHEALAFARSRSDWLAAQITLLPRATPPCPGGTIAYRGCDLVIAWDVAAGRVPTVDVDRLVIGGPRESLARRSARWLEAEAMRLMTRDLGEYCTRLGVSPPRLALSRARRRWGSCARDGTIRINWRLIMAPDAVRRSVIAHEVAHLAHFDHSPAFHACLRDLFEGSVTRANAWLKQHGPGLYQPFG